MTTSSYGIQNVGFCRGTCDGVKPKDLFTPNKATKLESIIAKMAVAQEACLNHISRESSDIRRLANFYKEVLTPCFDFLFICSSFLLSWFCVFKDIWVWGDWESRFRGFQGHMAESPSSFLSPPNWEEPYHEASRRALQRNLTSSWSQPSPQRPSYLLLRFQFRFLRPNSQGPLKYLLN